MSIFLKPFSHVCLLKLALLSLIFVCNPLHAMEHKPDLTHDKVLQTALQGHKFCPDYFFSQEGTIPLYDITVASSARTSQLHLENLKEFEGHQETLSSLRESILLSTSMVDNPPFSYWDLLKYPGYLFEAVGNNMPSLSWPSFSFFSTPTPEKDSSSTLKEKDEVLNPQDPAQGFYFIDNTPQDFTTKSTTQLTNTEFLGLSFDGGGVRGLMLAEWVKLIEKRTNRPVNQIFDLIGGTSIGGISALLLTASLDGKNPLMRGDQLEDLIEHSERIFPQRNRYNLPARIWDGIESLFYTRYSADPLKKLLQQYMGELTLSHSLTRTLITTVDATTVTPRIFDSFSPIDKPYKIWELGLCTSAAPTSFPAHRLSNDQKEYIDGGMAKNNPGLDVLKGLSEIPNFSFERTAILSLGTGNMPLGKIPTSAGLSSVGTIVDALFATQSKSVEMTLAELLPKGYFRANPTFDISISLDQLDTESIRLLKQGAESQYGVVETFMETDLVRKRLEK